MRFARGRRAATRAAFAAALAVAAGAAPATADEIGAPGAFLWRHDAWHVSLGPRIETRGVAPLTTGLANNFSFGGGGLPIFFTHRFGGLMLYGLAGELGYALPAGAPPPWLGDHARIFLFGRALWGGAQGSDLASGAPNGWSLVSVDNQRLAERFGQTNLTSLARVDERRWTLGLVATTDYALGAALFFSPALGLQIGRGRRGFRIVETLGEDTSDESFLPPLVRTVDARVRTDDWGGTLGARLTWRPSETLAFHIGGRVAFLARTVRLDVGDCLGTGRGGADPVCTGSVWITAAASRRSLLAVVPAGEIGLAYAPRPGWLLAIVGGLEFDPHSPGLALPTASDRRPARIEFRGHLGFNFEARLTVAFW